MSYSVEFVKQGRRLSSPPQNKIVLRPILEPFQGIVEVVGDNDEILGFLGIDGKWYSEMVISGFDTLEIVSSKDEVVYRA